MNMKGEEIASDPKSGMIIAFNLNSQGRCFGIR